MNAAMGSTDPMGYAAAAAAQPWNMVPGMPAPTMMGSTGANDRLFDQSNGMDVDNDANSSRNRGNYRCSKVRRIDCCSVLYINGLNE